MKSSGSLTSGLYDFEFQLWDQINGGSQIGSTIVTQLIVEDGIFATKLDFGSGLFDGTDMFLEISVKSESSATYSVLEPRQSITTVPYSQKADSVSVNSIGAIEIISTQVQTRVNQNCTDGSSIKEIGEDGSVTCETDDGLTSVTGDDIVNGSILNANFSNNTILGTKILDNTLPGSKVTNSSITGTKIANNQIIGTQHIQSNSITGNHILNGSLNSSDIDDGTLTGNDIADGSINWNDINTATVQRRVSGSCQNGFYMYAISEIGQVSCRIDEDGSAFLTTPKSSWTNNPNNSEDKVKNKKLNILNLNLNSTCPQNTAKIGIWCMENKENTPQSAVVSMAMCHSKGMSLCPIEALMTCDAVNSAGINGISCSSFSNCEDSSEFRTSTPSKDISNAAFDNLLTYKSCGSAIKSTALVSANKKLGFYCCQ